MGDHFVSGNPFAFDWDSMPFIEDIAPVASPTPTAKATETIEEHQIVAAIEQQQQVPKAMEQAQLQGNCPTLTAASTTIAAQVQVLVPGVDGGLYALKGNKLTIFLENKQPSQPSEPIKEPYFWEKDPNEPGISRKESRRRRKAASDHENRMKKKELLQEAEKLKEENASLKALVSKLQHLNEELSKEDNTSLKALALHLQQQNEKLHKKIKFLKRRSTLPSDEET